MGNDEYVTPESLRELAESAKGLLGHEWVEQQIRRDFIDDLPMLVQGFRRLAEWLETLRTASKPIWPETLLDFVRVLKVLHDISTLTGGDRVRSELQCTAHGENWPSFFDKLFEAEVALFLGQRGAKEPEFGPPGRNPDLWVRWPLPDGVVRVAVECKRINRAKESQYTHRLAKELSDLGERQSLSTGLKAVTWLHRSFDSNESWAVEDAKLVAPSLRLLLGDPRAENWVTVSDKRGDVQLSVALATAADITPNGTVNGLGSAGEVDVVALRHTDTGELLLRCAVNVRDERTSNRIGDLEGNLRQACRQANKEVLEGAPGIVAIRLRQPVDKGDVFEADRIVRQTLAKGNERRVSLVILFWDEHRETAIDDATGVQFASLALRGYGIVNPLAHIPFSPNLNSKQEMFPDDPEAVVRETTTGHVMSITAAEQQALRDSSDVRPELKFQPPAGEALHQDAGTAPLHWLLRAPLIPFDGFVPAKEVTAGLRKFRLSFLGEPALQCIEIRDATAVRIATVDLRAWLGATEIRAALTWSADSFVLEVFLPHANDSIRANSLPIRGVR